MLKKWLQIILDLIYPPRCPACRVVVGRLGEWCPKCLKKIPAEEAAEIPFAKHGIKYLDSCYAVCHYQGTVRNLILAMKFQKKKKYAPALTYLLEERLKKEYMPDFVVPVPLAAAKMQERGFNQTQEIFKPWAEKKGLVWLECLERQRATKPQWNLSAQERAANVKSAFTLTRFLAAEIKGKSILLVDDVLTSGSTVKECAKVLKGAQAGKVFVLTLAAAQ
jgi:ComF family protein